MLDNAEVMAQTYTHGTSRLSYISVSRKKNLSQEQHDALKHIISGGDMVSLTGYSGSGKSYVLSAVKDTYEIMGYQVIGAAETAMSAGNIKRSSGIEAQTIHRLSANLRSGKITFDENTVLVMDEASSINSKEMAVLVDEAKKSGSKIVLSSNPDQRQPFEPSSAARSIHKRVGGIELKEVLRQKVKWQQKATRMLSGTYEDVAQAINIYDARGKIQMKDTLEDAKKALVMNWSHKQDAVMIAFRNKDVTDLNTLARASLYKSGELKGKSQTVDTVKGPGEFCEGDKVLFLKDDDQAGITAGSFARIKKIENHKIQVRMDSGSLVIYDTSKYKSFTHGYAMGLNSTQNIEVDKTLVLGTRHFDKHLTNLALSRHREDTTLYVSRDEDGFKDHAHMKLLMARNREKPLMSEAETFKAERMDLSRIYKWDQYEIRFGLREKEFKKNLAVDPGLSYLEQRKFLEKKAKEFAAETVSRHKIKNYSGYSINVDPIDSGKEISLNPSSVVGLVNQGKINLIAGERDMIENAEIMAENYSHRLDGEKTIGVKTLKGLSEDQEKAFDHIVHGGDMVAITGHSGSGKSYLLGAVKEAYEQNDYTVLGVAASNIGAGNMKNVSGIESQSTYHFLKSVDSGKIQLDKNRVLIVDEANSIDVKTMSDILSRVEASGAKFVLSSNLNQKQPMEAGGAARSLTNAIGHQALTQVHRQRVKWQQEATQLLSGSYEDVVKAVSLYDENDKIHMEKSLPKAKEVLISAWEGKDERESLILALRKEDVSELNELARKALYRSGKLKEKGTIFKTSMGKAPFSNMDRIVFLKDDTEMGVSAGSFATIEKIEGSKVSARLDSGKALVYDTHKYTNFTHGYAVSLNNAENIDAKNTFVLGTRHFDRHLANLAFSRHKEDMKLYVSRDEMGFKDFAHMKLLMSRSRERSLISEAETVKKELVDIGKIYKRNKYQIEVSYGIQTYRKTITTDPRLKNRDLRNDLRQQARSFAEKISKQNKKDMSMMKIKVEFINPDKDKQLKAREMEKQKGYSKEMDDGPSF